MPRRRRYESSSDSSISSSGVSSSAAYSSSSDGSSSSVSSASSSSGSSNSSSNSSDSSSYSGGSSSSSSYHTFSDSSDDQHQGDMRALEKRICKELQCSNSLLVRLVLKEIGNYDVCKTMLKQTHRLEKGNGIRTADNSRRKTPGGVFFHLAMNRLGKKKFNQVNKLCDKYRKEKI
eukprot:snap_masked-scaffold_11-processed-gene-5.34-mRNA-1 protein AED:1.00 eAED:1.00 QI:0/-1/0/0/-1/1/1/0/175